VSENYNLQGSLNLVYFQTKCVHAELDLLLSSNIRQAALIIETDRQIVVCGSLAPVHDFTNRGPVRKDGKSLIEFREHSIRKT
jgi:hypothetical protein